ncbi:hypothetical protein P3T27_003467, partial [Kitasatospora sp. MAA19]|uniref:hypothetical protein n=1 Tax=Kitasatospora sp. MAA19 TaxID=3035090 RepID=UPI0024730D57
MLICADDDAILHGRRAHADHRDLHVAWSPDGRPTLVLPWDESHDDHAAVSMENRPSRSPTMEGWTDTRSTFRA